MKTGWLVNDKLTCIPGTRTFWHYLLEWFPGLKDMTGADFDSLPRVVEYSCPYPDYIIRNATYFRPLSVSVPTFSLLQDIVPVGSHLRGNQLAVSRGSTIIFPSYYAESKYPEIEDGLVIPLGVDFSTFAPGPPKREKWNIAEGAVLFVGSGDPIKGFATALQLSEHSFRPFVFVMKDDTPVSTGNRVLRHLSSTELREVINCCAVGIVPSLEETQHLAGIEMGACGLPLVTTNVGAYWNRPEGAWGCVSGNFHNDIEWVAGRTGAREYWIRSGYTKAQCRRNWEGLLSKQGLV
jgi:glycosyltransferase involved in cell wall biosynthesis